MSEIRILVAPQLKDELERDGLLDLDALVARESKDIVKARLDSRQTFRLRTSSCRVLYLKLYHQVEPEGMLAGLFAQKFESPASREWHVLNRLHELEIPTMHPAACIEQFEDGKVIRAALLTVGLEAPVSLQKMILEEFSEYPQAKRRQAIARDLGKLLRRMHDGGVNHRDFYLVHIRVGSGDRLFVTDLNRADIRKRVTRRWKVKDLAALLHSAPSSIVTATDRARFAKAYFGDRLRYHRTMIEAIQRKAARMTAHTRKRMRKGDRNYHVVE